MKQKKQLKEESTLVWYLLRGSFWIMIAVYFLLMLMPVNSNQDTYQYKIMIGITLFWMASIVFCFICSIVHLNKYEEKAFAIVSLVISSLFMLLGLLVTLLI